MSEALAEAFRLGVDALFQAGHKRVERRNQHGASGGILRIIRQRPSTLEAHGIRMFQVRLE
jgi:hypothetical protein